MKRVSALTSSQKEKLNRLEPQLRTAAKSGDFAKAKLITQDIQRILRPTGHETRILQAKNWLFESALEANEIEFAINGFTLTRKKVAKNTRIYLEATALLAICYLRKNQVQEAEPLMAAVLKNDFYIRSEKRRRQFRSRIIRRFEEEAAVASFRNKYREHFNPEEIQNDAGKMIQQNSEDDLFSQIGKYSPPETKAIILRIEDFSRKQLPKSDIKLLPDPRDRIKDEEVGRTVFSSVKRVLWRSLCDPNSEIYKIWFNKGFGIILNKFYISSAVTAALSGLGIGIRAVAVLTTAIIIKFGLEIYCDRYKPEGIMIER